MSSQENLTLSSSGSLLRPFVAMLMTATALIAVPNSDAVVKSDKQVYGKNIMSSASIIDYKHRSTSWSTQMDVQYMDGYISDLKSIFETIKAICGVEVTDYWVSKTPGSKQCLFISCDLPTGILEDDFEAISQFADSLYTAAKPVLNHSDYFEMVSLL